MAGILLAAQEILVNLSSELVTVHKAIAPLVLAAVVSAGASLVGSGLNFYKLAHKNVKQMKRRTKQAQLLIQQ